MRQFNIEIDKTSPKTNQFTVPAYEHFSILVRYKNWEDKQQWLNYTLADETGADIVKYKQEDENNSVLYFCSYISTSTKLHLTSTTQPFAFVPRDTIQVVASPSSTQYNCYICSADYARTAGEGGGGGGGVSQEYVDGKVQEEATARAAADEALRADIPTKTSQLDNDSGYFTESQLTSDYYNKTEVDTKIQETSIDLKTSLDDVRAEIPTKTSQLTNDSGYLTQEGTIANADRANSANIADNVEWLAVQNRPTTLDGYGITDAATKAEFDSLAAEVGTANTQLEEIA